MKLKPSSWLSGNGRIHNVYVNPSVALGTASWKFVDEAVYSGPSISSNLEDDSDV